MRPHRPKLRLFVGGSGSKEDVRPRALREDKGPLLGGPLGKQGLRRAPTGIDVMAAGRV